MWELLTAVKRGDEERARALLDCPEFYSFPSWKLGQGIVLMREALKRNHGRIARLLLSKGARVNHNKLGQPTDDPLHLAVTQPGNVGIVKELLRSGAQVNGRNADGCTPLHLAASFEDNCPTICLLLKNHADVNAKDLMHFTPLHRAVEHSLVDVVELLCVSGADVNMPSVRGVTPLELACTTPNLDTLPTRLNRGADVNVNASEGQTVIDLAYPYFRGGFPIVARQIEANSDKMLSTLLQYGAKVNAINRNGKTVLYQAVEEDRLITATLLVKCANVNALSFDDFEKCLLTPLHIAIILGHTAMVKLLLEHQADVNFTCNTSLGGNYTPLHLACSYGRLEIVKLLLDHEADIEAKSFKGCTPIFSAVSSPFSKSFIISSDIVHLLVARGALVDTLDYEGCSILHAAVETKLTTKILLVLGLFAEKHCDVKKFANLGTLAEGLTPLHFAAAAGCNLEIIDALLMHGSCVDATATCKITPLHLACDGLHPDLIEFLLSNGAKVNTQASGGSTPAHLLLALSHFLTPRDRERSLAALQILLKEGADLTIADNKGYTLPTLAVCVADINIVRAIFAYRPSADCCKLTLRMAIKQLNHQALNNSHRTVEEIKAIVQELQDYGITLDEAAVNDVELLNCAAQFGFTEVVKDLLRMGADVSTPLRVVHLTPLHSAVLGLQEDIVKLLLRAGAHVNSKDRKGVCPIGYLKRWMKKLKNSSAEKASWLLKCFRIAEDLARSGAKLESSFLIEAVRLKLHDFVILALNCGADVNVKDEDGYTLLHTACQADIAIVRLLLDRGALVNATDGQGRTPLHLAALSNDADLIKTLVLEFGADVNAKDIMYGSTALHLASELGQPRAAVALLRCGADVGARTTSDLTALHLAVARPNDSGPSIVQSLLAFGADPLSKSVSTETPASSIHETTPIVVCCQEGGHHKSLDAMLDHADLPHNVCCYLVQRFPHLSAGNPPEALVRQFLNLDVRKLRPPDCPCLKIVSFGEPSVVSNEIDKMTQLEVFDGFSFYDLITKTKSQLIALARNEALVTQLKSISMVVDGVEQTNKSRSSREAPAALPLMDAGIGRSSCIKSVQLIPADGECVEVASLLTSSEPCDVTCAVATPISTTANLPCISVPAISCQFPIFAPLLAYRWSEATRRRRLLSDGLVAFNTLIVQSIVSLVKKMSLSASDGSQPRIAEQLEAVGYRWLVDLLNTNSDGPTTCTNLASELTRIEFLLPETIVEKIIENLTNEDLEILALTVL